MQHCLRVRQPSEDLWKTRSKISLLTRIWTVTSSYLWSSDLHIASYALTCICCKRFSASDNSPNIHWTRLSYRLGSLRFQYINLRLYFPYRTGKLTLSLCLFLFNHTQNIRIPQGATKPSPHQEGPPQVFTWDTRAETKEGSKFVSSRMAIPFLKPWQCLSVGLRPIKKWFPCLILPGLDEALKSVTQELLGRILSISDRAHSSP